ncbi:hypothetical protein NX029_02385 [Cytobacillus firmus]|nr:hypothetical protein [Cytobacillus firmus]
MKQKRFFPICAGFFWPLRLYCFICRYLPALYDGIVNRFRYFYHSGFFGVSLHDSARKVNKSLEIADQYLYQAKNTGKNQVHFECGKVMKNHDTKLKSVFVS